MNGSRLNKIIQDDPSHSFLEQVKKNEDIKKRKNLKLIFLLIFTNLFVAYLVYPSQSEKNLTIQTHLKIHHPGFKMMILNINPLMQIDTELPEIKISLITNQKHIILSLGYLHEEIKNELEPNNRRFKIEIPEHQMLELGALADEKLIAIPAIENKIPTNLKKESSYEVNI